MGATKIPEFPSTFVFPSYGHLALVVHADDFVLSGDSSYHDGFWRKLSKRIMLDDFGDLRRFLEQHHSRIKWKGQEFFAFDMRAYAESIVNDYSRVMLSSRRFSLFFLPRPLWLRTRQPEVISLTHRAQFSWSSCGWRGLLDQTCCRWRRGWLIFIIELYYDADFCGDDDHAYSTSGGWIQLSGQGTHFQ